MWLAPRHDSAPRGDSGYLLANYIYGMLPRASALKGLIVTPLPVSSLVVVMV
jgi:hypothetical protein